MIIQALYKYYNILLEKEGDKIPREGYSSADVSFEIHIGANGELLEIIQYMKNGTTVKKKYLVPEQGKRTSNPKPYFLCDKAEYMFGEAISMRAECRKKMQEMHTEVLEFVRDETAEVKALRRFIAKQSEQLSTELYAILNEEIKEALQSGGLCVIKYASSGKFLHQTQSLLNAWEKYLEHKDKNQDSNEKVTCLVTGEKIYKKDISELHPNIKNITGAKSSGAAIVSFNEKSFCSYKKDKSFNAPTSNVVTNAYGYVLNRLTADSRHRVRLNDTTVVFWAESTTDHEQIFLTNLLSDLDDEVEQHPDSENVRERIKSAVNCVRQGQTFTDTFSDLDSETTFYLLGLSPNAARLSVRFFYRETIGEIGERIWQHFKDLSIDGLESSPTIRQLLIELVSIQDRAQKPRESWKKIPPNMEGQLLLSIIHGKSYSKAIYAQLINRIRADTDAPEKSLYKIGPVRAAMLKACLIRNMQYQNRIKEGELTVSENKESTNVAYQLGRLFACLEKTQANAHRGEGASKNDHNKADRLNATIRDRFWGAASTSPATVFPRLISLAQHHISKDEQWGEYNNSLIQEVMGKLPERLPRRLSLEEQGMFAIGYYHRRQSFYSKEKNA